MDTLTATMDTPTDNYEEPSSAPTSNFEKWQYYLKDLVSPQSYVDWGYYWLVAAALQRRVWLPPDHNKLYCNMYVIPVGDPGLGKGLVIKKVAEVLRYHRIESPTNAAADPRLKDPNLADKDLIEAAAETNYSRAQAQEDSFGNKLADGKKKSFEKPLLIPVAADAVTYEALVKCFSESFRHIEYVEFSPKLGKNTVKLYGHSSLAFCLEEISSLFRRKAEDVAKFMLNAYDCGDYEYETKTQGKDRIKRCCLNFFGGTTPSFMQRVFNDELLTDGFAARTFFIYETKNREQGFFIPDLNETQKQYKQDIIDHVKKLTKLYGSIQLGEGVTEFLESWWNEWKDKRINNSPKMESYYSRKKVHILKLATAIHFGESTSMTIEVPSFEKAIQVLSQLEAKMHLALAFDNRNPLYKCSKTLLKYLQMNGPTLGKDLLVELWPELPAPAQESFEEMLTYMLSVNQIISVKGTNKLGETVNFYSLPKSLPTSM